MKSNIVGNLLIIKLFILLFFINTVFAGTGIPGGGALCQKRTTIMNFSDHTKVMCGLDFLNLESCIKAYDTTVLEVCAVDNNGHCLLDTNSFSLSVAGNNNSVSGRTVTIKSQGSITFTANKGQTLGDIKLTANQGNIDIQSCTVQ
ncbi:MAG: hypothetical protein KIT27_07180 [Legionellales bacterium]|nr:hypothetical protein [Legionellales bacterium]